MRHKTFQMVLVGLMLAGWLTFLSERVEAAVVINEIMANPNGDDNENESSKEWVELYNSDGNDLVTEGWYMKDAKNPKKLLSNMSSVVSSDKKYLVYKVKETGGWLNNDSSDSVELYDKSDQRIDGYSYNESKIEGVTWGRNPDGESVWALMQSATPGTGNSGPIAIPTLSPTPMSSSSPTPTNIPTQAATSTPAPTKAAATATKVPTVVPSIKKEITPEAGTSGQISPGEEGEVLGEDTEAETTATPTEVQEATVAAKSSKVNWLAVGLVGGGAVMLGAAGVPMLKGMRRRSSSSENSDNSDSRSF